MSNPFSVINSLVSSANDLSRTIRECSTSSNVRKIKEIEEKKLSEKEKMVALLDALADMPEEDRNKVFSALKEAKKEQGQSNEKQITSEKTKVDNKNTQTRSNNKDESIFLDILPGIIAIAILCLPFIVGIIVSIASTKTTVTHEEDTQEEYVLEAPKLSVTNSTRNSDGSYNFNTGYSVIGFNTGLDDEGSSQTTVTINGMPTNRCSEDDICYYKISLEELGYDMCTTYHVVATNEKGSDSLDLHMAMSDGTSACKENITAAPYTYEHVSGQGMLGTRTYIYISDFVEGDANYEERIKATIASVMKSDSNIDPKSAWIQVFTDRSCYIQEQNTGDCSYSDSNYVAEYESYDYSSMNRQYGTDYSSQHDLTLFPASKSGKTITKTWKP